VSSWPLAWVVVATLSAAITVSSVSAGGPSRDDLTPRERLGKFLFFDESLSARGNQACATCHAPEAGWVGANEAFNRGGAVYEGSVSALFGNRKPPSAAYATEAPTFHLMHPHHAMFVGGNFWDGRATGRKLGNPAADQAMGPFLNPVEQALPDAKTLVEAVCGGQYGALFRQVWGVGACDDVRQAYEFIALAIAAFEASSEVNQFSSKYDSYLAGRTKLTAQEERGLQLFEGKAQCATCHPHRPSRAGAPPLFTDFTFENLGIPANPANPFYADTESNPLGTAWRDEGLGAVLAKSDVYSQYAPAQMGRHRVPTLRNVDLRPHETFVKAYGHNGYFKSLEAIVHFYNTRDLLPACRRLADRPGVDCWPQPEIAANVNRRQLGALGLTHEEEAAIVAFLRTLSDGPDPRR
jgi:cytochrome c peroxidase